MIVSRACRCASSFIAFPRQGEQQHVVRELAEGTVVIVIGTHRLLQQDIRFKRLGLVILDEEHRFGVRQKERLKELRAEVDVLTMTATPDPAHAQSVARRVARHLVDYHRPEGRLSVKTTVGEANKALLREACLREIRRGGQVYYLHNEVSTIDKAARELKELVPEADIHWLTAKCPNANSRRIMLDFYHRRFNILVCSTIIESGIDVPTANTIIVERADKFGLAQLPPAARARRTLAPSRLRLPADPRLARHQRSARKRLEAIQSISELGAGFALRLARPRNPRRRRAAGRIPGQRDRRDRLCALRRAAQPCREKVFRPA